MRGSNSIFEKTSRLVGSKQNSISILHKVKKLKNIGIGFLGAGNVFGDVDVVLKRNYVYSLKVNKVGSSVYILKA